MKYIDRKVDVVFTADMKVITAVTEWKFPDNRQRNVFHVADLCKDLELRIAVFRYVIVMKG
jgi:hypothetical protein